MLLFITIVKFNSANDMGRVLREMTRSGNNCAKKCNFPVKREHLHQSDVLIYIGVALANIQNCLS